MSDLADKLGTNQSNLYKSLKKNPTLTTLQDVATALGVHISDLFPDKRVEIPSTSLAILDNGVTYGLVKFSGIVQIPHFTSHLKLQTVVKSFISDALKSKIDISTCGIVESYVLFALIYSARKQVFHLSLCYSESQMLTFSYDCIEYSDFKGKYDVEQISTDILIDIEDSARLKIIQSG